MQSSNVAARQKTRELLEKHKEVISTPIIKSLAQLEELDENITNFYAQFPDLEINIKGKESEKAYMRMLFQSVQDFGFDIQNILNRFEVFLNKSKKSLEDFLGNNDKNGNTVLHLAVEEKEHESIDLLLSKMKSEDIIKKTANERLDTALHIATRYNDIEAVQKLLAKLNTPHLDIFLEARDNFGYTALHWASAMGYVDIIHLLSKAMKDDMLARVIQAGYEDEGVPTQVRDSLTLLHLAVYSCNSEVIKTLGNILSQRSVQFSQLITTADKDGYTPLHLSLVKNLINLKNALQDVKDYGKLIIYTENHQPYEAAWNYKLLRSIAQEGNVKMVEELLKFSSNDQLLPLISQTDSNGYSILHFAVLGGSDIVKLILSKINKSHYKIITEKSAEDSLLNFAAQHAKDETIKVLLDALSRFCEGN